MIKQWVIPDIHGCVRSLKALIEEQIVPSIDDQLIFLGDYVDRGPDSKGVIDYIIGLQDKGHDIIALKGNHEEFFVKSWDDDQALTKILFFKAGNASKKEWMKHGGRETLQSFGTNDLAEIPEHYIEWMRNLKLYHETGDFVLVHAGMNFRIDDPFSDEWAMLWFKDYKIIPEKIGYRRLIHGHTPVNLEFINNSLQNPSQPFIDLDNGCYMINVPGFGNLVALELGSLEWKIQPNLDMD